MKNTIFILVGLPGSGKTTAAGFFKEKSIPVIRMGDVTEKLLKKEGKKITEKNEQGVREDLRKTYGSDIYARLSVSDIEREMQKNEIVVIEGMMSVSEKEFFESKFSNIKIIFIESPKRIRIQRLSIRNLRPLTEKEAEKREGYEIDTLGKLELKKEADAVVPNKGNMKDFYNKLEETLKKFNDE